MKKSRHFQTRMNHRGFTGELISVLLDFGDVTDDKVFLNRKQTRSAIQKLDEVRSLLIKLIDKGGGVIIHENGQLITTYRAE